MKKISDGFIIASVIVLFIFGYFQGVVVPKTEQKYSYQQASVVNSLKNLPGIAKGILPCNPQLTKCGMIKVRKDTIPDSYQDFYFSHNIPGYQSTFTLDDDITLISPSPTPNIQSFMTPYSGVFTITETTTPGFDTSIECTNSQTGAVQVVPGASVSINLTNAHTYSCVFTNKANGSVPPVTACTTPNTWTQRADFGGGTRRSPAGFSIGTKGYVGTGMGSLGGLSDLWEYNPATNIWTQKANFGGGNREGAVGFSIGTKGYIGLGKFGYQNYYSDFWEYNPATNIWTQKANFGGEPREFATGFSISSKGYVGVGTSYYASVGYISYQDFWEYNPATNVWTEKANFGGGNRSGSVGFSIGNKGYLGMGKYLNNLGNGPLYQDFWEYNPATNVWTEKANFGGGYRMLATGFSIGGKGYAGTGRGALPGNSVTYRNDLWEYNPATNVWTEKANLGIFGRSDAVGFSIGTKGYIGTGLMSTPVGNNWNLQSSQDFWCYMP